MGCCKDTSNKLIKESPELTPKYVIKKIISIILVGTILLVLTPFIVLMIWYLGMRMIIGTDSDYLGMLSKKYWKNKARAKYLDKVDKVKGEVTEFNPDDYELLDVDVIK
jgi:hypothetical protein